MKISFHQSYLRAKKIPLRFLFIPEVSDKSSKKYSFDKVVQKGTPGNYKRGIYAYLIDGTWNRLIIIYICTFVFINIFFAMIYNSSPKSVGGVGGNSFMEMFYFSVETMSTIGYGQKYPESGFGNFVVTLEALVGILFGAVVTGITFTKFSSMGDSMFSDKMLITDFEDKKALMLRLEMRGVMILLMPR